jgi:hypothetical protein
MVEQPVESQPKAKLGANSQILNFQFTPEVNSHDQANKTNDLSDKND